MQIEHFLQTLADIALVVARRVASEGGGVECGQLPYVRISHSSQIDGHSLDAQERLFHQLCQNRSWPSVRVYQEEGRSAHSDSLSKRPVLRQLLDDAGKGQFDVVVVHTLDPWARNLKVLLETVGMLSQHGVGLVSVTENLDWSTPEGRLVASTAGSFGELFSDMLGTHVKKGIAERAHLGLHLGSIPFGYEPCWERVDGERRRTCNPEHPGGVHLVEKEAEAVREMFKRYATSTAPWPSWPCGSTTRGSAPGTPGS